MRNNFLFSFPKDFWCWNTSVYSLVMSWCQSFHCRTVAVLQSKGGGEQGRPVLTLCLFLSFSMECLGLLSLITYIASRIISLCTSNSNKVNMLLIKSGSHVCCSGVDGRLTWHTHTHTHQNPSKAQPRLFFTLFNNCVVWCFYGIYNHSNF